MTARAVRAALALALIAPTTASAAGFEVGENTAKSIARGGTGVASARGPSALYLNPALLSRARGLQLQADASLIDLSLTFERRPIAVRDGPIEAERRFAPVEQSGAPIVTPFLAASWDLGRDDLAIGVALFTPPAYSGACYGEGSGSSCELESSALEGPEQIDPNGARHLLLGSDLAQIYASAGIGWRTAIGPGTLSLGAAGALAYQRTSFALVIDADPLNPGPPFYEDPDTEAIFRARDLSGWNLTGFFGAAWTVSGLTIAASWRPPMSWRTTGRAELELTPSFQEVSRARLTDDEIRFETAQASSLRLGAAWEEGEHPGGAAAPRLLLEANLVWEDWSRVEAFDLELEGDLALFDDALLRFAPVRQPKRWRDTTSLRLGGAWGAHRWVTLSAGGALESGAQPISYTNLDFPSWSRRWLTLGATIHPSSWLDLDLGFALIWMPEREVTTGALYPSAPIHPCRGPDFTGDRCSEPGTPPGLVQNNGSWRDASYRIASAGITARF